SARPGSTAWLFRNAATCEELRRHRQRPSLVCMQLLTGLNPYGLTYYLGLQGMGTARTNPAGKGLEGFIELATELGSRVLEVWDGWLAALDEASLRALGQRLGELGMVPIVSSGFQRGDIDACMRYADVLGADRIRFAMTPILCGDRAAAGPRWYDLLVEVRRKLEEAAGRAEGR